MFNDRTGVYFKSSIGKYPKHGDSPRGDAPAKLDPAGYSEIEATLGRGKKTNGIFLSVVQGLKFPLELRDYLKTLLRIEGALMKCRLLVEQRNPFTDHWELKSDGMLDPLSYKDDGTFVEMDFYENSFSEKFDSYIKEKFEVDRPDDVEGNTIPAPPTKRILHDGRKVFLRSLLYLNEDDKMDFENSNSNLFENVAIKFKTEYNSDPENIAAPFEADMDEAGENASKTYGNGRAGNMFYLTADRNHTITLNGKIHGYFIAAASSTRATLDLIRYKKDDNNNYIVQEVITLKTFNNPSSSRSVLYEFKDYVIDVKEGESLCLAFAMRAGGKSDLFFYDDSKIEITENDLYPPTQNIVVRAFDVGRQLVKIIDKNAEFESDVLNEYFEHLVMCSGETIRNVHRTDEAGNSIKVPILTTSFEEFFETINMLIPVAYDVVFNNGKNVVTLNYDREYFLKKQVINLGKVTNLTREVNPEWVYGSIKIGYENSGKIEDFYGLYATHTINTYTLPTVTDNTYEVTSKMRAETLEVEEVRRIQWAQNPDKDHRYDKDTFLFDCYLPYGEWNSYKVRPNTMDFDYVKGFKNVETTYNNRLSLMQCLYRHGSIFKSGTQHLAYNDKKVRYGSTQGNNTLITKAKDLPELADKESYYLTMFLPARAGEMLSKFDVKLDNDYDTWRASDPETDKFNKYGLAKFEDEEGNVYTGYLYKGEFKEGSKYEMRSL